MNQTDEEYALELVEAFLRKAGFAAPSCKLVAGDPPDIICEVAGEKWAIEVTRVNQRLIRNYEEKPRTETDTPLLKFGEYLGGVTADMRRLKYLLVLSGPSTQVKWSKWKKDVQRAVEQFIISQRLGSCDFSGGFITAFPHGHDWDVAVGLHDDATAPGGHMTSNITRNIEAMLKYALEDKAKKLANVAGFKRIGLVLLNTYFFGDDVDQVERALQAIIGENGKPSNFDFVFYVAGAEIRLIYGRVPSGLPAPGGASR